MPSQKHYFMWTDEIRVSNTGQYRPWIIQYWEVVLVLTLLSAYLILWKPRKRPTA